MKKEAKELVRTLGIALVAMMAVSLNENESAQDELFTKSFIENLKGARR